MLFAIFSVSRGRVVDGAPPLRVQWRSVGGPTRRAGPGRACRRHRGPRSRWGRRRAWLAGNGRFFARRGASGVGRGVALVMESSCTLRQPRTAVRGCGAAAALRSRRSRRLHPAPVCDRETWSGPAFSNIQPEQRRPAGYPRRRCAGRGVCTATLCVRRTYSSKLCEGPSRGRRRRRRPR